MNSNGNNTEAGLSQGGEIDGDLLVIGQVDTVNLNVSDTATISTLITQQELEVKDPLITCGVDNIADNVNLGLIEEYTDLQSGSASQGGKKWAGLVRDRATKVHYLLRDETIKPSPTSSMPATNDLLGSLKVNSLICDQVVANNFVAAKTGISLGTPGTGYLIDPVRGTNGQVLSYTNGTTQWVNQGGGTLQSNYDISTAPQITTTAGVNEKLVLKQGVGSNSTIFELQNSVGDKRIGFNTDGIIDVQGLSSAIEFNDINGVKKWEIVKSQLDQQLEFRNETGAIKLLMKQNGETIFVVDGGEQLTINPSGISTTSSSANSFLLKDDLQTVKWTDTTVPLTFVKTINNASNQTVQLTTQTGATIFKVNSVNKLDVNTSGIIVDGVVSCATLESENITVKKVGYKNNVGDDRFSQEWDTDKLITKNANGNNLSVVEQDGTTTFNVDGIKIFEVDSAGTKTSWCRANVFLTNDYVEDFATWIQLSEPTTYEKKIKNATNVLVHQTTQAGEQKFLVSGSEVLNIDSTGLTIGDNLKSSSFVSEIRDVVPVIPSSIVWTDRPEYVGELSFSLGDTLVNFNSTVSQRSVESINYAILGKIPVGSSVDMSMQLNSVVGNDIMLGVQFTDGTEQNIGSLVGRNKSQYYILITKSGDLSKMVEAGVETVDANPNISAADADYTASLARTSSTSWRLSFQQNLTTITTVITFSGVEWSSKKAHFLIGDRSNVPSSFNMLIQTTDSINYNATQELYTIEQKNNELTIFDESGVDLTSIGSNVVKINKPLKTNDITTNDIDSTKFKCNETAYKGLTPNASQLKLGGWDNTVSLFNTNVSGTNNKTVSFPLDGVKRSIPSKFFFIPNDIQVGGYCQYNIKTVATDHYYSLGLVFKDPQNYWFGQDTFNSVNHWWALLGSGLDYAYVRGSFALNLTSVNLNPVANSIVKVRITRISSVEWRITYGIGTSFTTENISFGVEEANKFCYATVCMFRVIAGSCTYELNDFEYNLWNPSTNNYNLKQDTNNNLLLTDNANTKLLTVNPNQFVVNTAVKTTSNMTINSNKFTNGAVVGGTFYTSVIGPVITGTTPIHMHTSTVGTFGSIQIPQLSIGNIIKVKMSGIIATGGSDEYFTVKAFWGPALPTIGGVQLATSDINAKVLKDIANLYWELELTVLPTTINFLNGTVSVRTYGMYRYNAGLTNQKTYEGASIIDTGVAVAVPNVPTELNITGQWNLVNAAFKVSVLHCSYSYEGFNL